MAASSRLKPRRAEDRADQPRVRAHVAADHHVLQRRHLGEQPDVLEGARDARLGHLVHRAGLVGLAAELEAAAVGDVQAGDDVEEGGLAGAVGADQAVDLAALDGDAHVGQRLQAAETLADAGDLENGLCHVVSLRVQRADRCGLAMLGRRPQAARTQTA